MALELRDYQKDAHEAHWRFIDTTGPGNHPLVVVPTGGGKSLLIAEFIREAKRRDPNRKIAVLAHVQELIEQNHAELHSQLADEPELQAQLGIYCAGLNRKDRFAPINFVGVHSLFRKPLRLGVFDDIIVDEAHMVPFAGLGMYRSVFDAQQTQNPALRVHGYTATPYRLDGGKLHTGEGRVFTDIAYEVEVERLVRDGYLAPLIARNMESKVDTTGIKIVGGDYAKGALDEAASNLEVVEAACDELVELAASHGRKHWLVFGCGVHHAQMVADVLRQRHGVRNETIFGETPKVHRREIIERFKAGDIPCLINFGVLTTGFNAPRIDLMAVMRPTVSTSLYVQMMGRGMRTFPGKENCLVLDYGMNVERHGPINRVEVKDPKEKDDDQPGKAPMKECPDCHFMLPIAARECEFCGFEFPIEMEPKHVAEAGTLAPLDMSAPTPWVEVLQVRYDVHIKPGGDGTSRTLKVSYQVQMPSNNSFGRIRHKPWVTEWVCPEHTGWARDRFERWWLAHRGETPVPEDVAESIARAWELDQPVGLMLDVEERNGREFFKIQRRRLIRDR